MKTITFEVPDNSYRITEKDYIYYNSDLNKFIGEELPKIMTSIDCDLLQHKKSKKILRFAEYKHEGEAIKLQQLEALQTIANIFDFVNKNKFSTKLECVIIVGNPPFKKLQVWDLTRGIKIQFEGQQQIQDYLTLEADPKDYIIIEDLNIVREW